MYLKVSFMAMMWVDLWFMEHQESPETKTQTGTFILGNKSASSPL